MKKEFRMLIGFMVVTPFALIAHFLTIFTDKQKAVAMLGPKVTTIAKSMQQFFPPKVNSASEFDLFILKCQRMKKIWGILYDYPIEYPDQNTVKLTINNCPFADALIKLKVPEFGHFMCQGDWEVAIDNSEKWKFERNCTIATGGTICDFTYKRI